MVTSPQRCAGLLALLGIAGCVASVRAEDRLTMWGTPPREKPHFTKAAEGFPPLPLPVVPQRRTEKKRPPAPPNLLANVSNFSFKGWTGSPGAVDQLLKNAKQKLKLWYGWEQLDIDELARKHAASVQHATPILYFCAFYPLALSDAQRAALADYTTGGGTLVINCCGQEAAFDSARAELAQMFPRHELRLLPPDHPLYHAYDDIDKVTYPVPSASPLDEGAAEVAPPRLWGITLGTRAAVIVSLEDLACGWNEWNNPGVKRVSTQDSTRIGLNLITYIAAELRYAKFLARTREVAGPAVRPRQQLVLVQLVHDGNWNPNPSAVPFFLKELASNTSIAVRFERKTMAIKDPTLFDHPLLYMTGSWDPALSKEEIALLHRHLSMGGTLLADAAAGRAEFEQAFRSLCQSLFPGQPLQPLPADHPLFSCFHKLGMLHLNHESEPQNPVIEAVVVDGRAVILYSRYGLSDGWAHQFSSYARSYATPDALQLGTNMIVFAMQ